MSHSLLTWLGTVRDWKNYEYPELCESAQSRKTPFVHCFFSFFFFTMVVVNSGSKGEEDFQRPLTPSSAPSSRRVSAWALFLFLCYNFSGIVLCLNRVEPSVQFSKILCIWTLDRTSVRFSKPFSHAMPTCVVEKDNWFQSDWSLDIFFSDKRPTKGNKVIGLLSKKKIKRSIT